MRFTVLIIGFVIFVLMLKYRGQIFNFTGSISFGEKYFGGTGNLIVAVAIFIFVFCLMYAVGSLDAVFNSTFGKFF
ncbi:MAG: hypothetical protein WC873_01085 [Candidatus Gracilibacteria bacterium]